MTVHALPDPVWQMDASHPAQPDPQQRLSEAEIEEYYADHPEEETSTISKIELAYHQAVTQIAGDPVYDQSPEAEQVITHALAILPHLGPEATAAFLTSVHGQGLHRALPPDVHP